MSFAPFRLDCFKASKKIPWIVTIVLVFLLLKGGVFLASKLGAFGGMENGFAFIGVSATYSLFLTTFLLCIMAAASLSGEYASGLLRMHLARPVSRNAYLLGRIASMILVSSLPASPTNGRN